MSWGYIYFFLCWCCFGFVLYVLYCGYWASIFSSGLLLGHSLGHYLLVVVIGPGFYDGVCWWLFCFSAGLLFCIGDFGTSMVWWTYLCSILGLLNYCLSAPIFLVWLSYVRGSIEQHFGDPSDGCCFCDFLSSIIPYSWWAFNCLFSFYGLPIIQLSSWLMIIGVSIACHLSHFFGLAAGVFNMVDILFIDNIRHYDFNHHNTNHFGSLSYPSYILFYSNMCCFVLSTIFSVHISLFKMFL